MSNNNNLSNEDIEGLYEVNTTKVLNNVKNFGVGNNNTSPYIRSPYLNNLPRKNGRRSPFIKRVPKLKMPPVIKQNTNNTLKTPDIKQNNTVKNLVEKKNSNQLFTLSPVSSVNSLSRKNRKTRKGRKNRKNRKNTRKN